jgi:hypothetical protein
MTPLQTNIKLFSSASYNGEATPPLGKQTIIYKPDNVDLIRYRLGKVYDSTGEFVSDRTSVAGSISYKVDRINFAHTTTTVTETVGGLFGQTTTTDVNTLTPDKQILKIEPIRRIPGGMFSTSTDESNTYNQQPSLHNWVNSITSLAGVSNPLGIIPPQYGADNKFVDLTFDFGFAVDDRYKNLINPPSDMKGASVEIIYNHYNQTYENVMNYESYVSSSAQRNAFQLEETLLPSYYAIESVVGLTDPSTQGNMEAWDIFSLKNTLPHDIFRVSHMPGVPTSLSTLDYFTEYAKKIFELRNAPTPNSDLEELSSNQKNIILQGSQINELMQDTDKILSDLPMYAKISFDMKEWIGHSAFNPLMIFLKDNNLWSAFITHCIGRPTNTSEFNIYAKSGIPFSPDDNLYSGVTQPESLGSIDIDGFGASLFASIYGHIASDTFIAGTHSEEIAWTDFNTSVFNDASAAYNQSIAAGIYSVEFNDIHQQLGTYRRDYHEIINHGRATIVDDPTGTEVTVTDSSGTYTRVRWIWGEETLPEGVSKSWSFPIFYKVEKWSVDANNNPNSLIQNFYVPNTGEIDRATIYDTQVKYGKKYIYRIYAYNLVIGTTYHYSLDDVTQPQGYENDPQKELSADICVFTEANIQLVKTPYYQKPTLISDKPPVSPDISVYPYFGDKNKIKFLLKSNTGIEQSEPIVIKPEDEVIFNGIRKAFNLGPQEKITFQSDDPSVKFDVFRLDRRPTSYQDFKFAEYRQIETSGFQNPYKKAASADLSEFIEPNKKYYYTFRSVDVHGKISNPSPIYQVEISYDGASPFLLTEIISLTPEKVPPQSVTKKLKKYLRIRPNYQQTLLNEKATGIIDSDGKFDDSWFPTLAGDAQNPGQEIILGDEESSLWGKTFKIRITSRKSGKKIDLNVKFETNKVIINQTDVNNIS